jgi:hypothetical protein
MSPFESLYGRKCNIPISLNNPVDRVTIGPDMLKEMEHQVIQIRKNMKISQDRQKSYADMKRTPREFKEGDHVYLRVRPRKISFVIPMFPPVCKYNYNWPRDYGRLNMCECLI